MRGKPGSLTAGKVALALGVLLLLVAACAPSAATNRPSTPTGTSFPMTITDDAGRAVTIKTAPKRVISLAPSNTEILYALDLGDMVVGVDSYSDYPPQARQKEQVGGYSTPSLEKVVALAPDLILATQIHSAAVVPALEQRGLTVVVLAPKQIEGVLDNIRLIGRITGHTTKAAEVATALGQRIERVTAKTQGAPRLRVFFELSPELSTVGPGTFIDDLVAKAGGENIAADATTSWPRLSQEVVILRNPEVIVLGEMGSEAAMQPESVKARPAWQGVRAVKEDRVYRLNPDLIHRPGPRVIDGLEQMAKAIHPELFP